MLLLVPHHRAMLFDISSVGHPPGSLLSVWPSRAVHAAIPGCHVAGVTALALAALMQREIREQRAPRRLLAATD